MNFLAHHVLARQVAPNAPATFFVGNLLPDLISGSGAGSVRKRHFAEPVLVESSLRRGMRLHLATDRRFHSHSAFADAQADAKAALLSAAFTNRPRRIFFFAHAFVEVALDGLLMRENPSVADDLYACCSAVDTMVVGRDAAALLAGPDSLAAIIAERLQRFTEQRYLYRYASGAGQAGALERIAHRAGLEAFESPDDHALLAALFDTFTPKMAAYRSALLLPPPDFT